MTYTLLEITLAAFLSALSVCPQDKHKNLSWVFLFFLSVYPHSEHSRLVLRASIATIETPESAALYSRNALSWKNDQECRTAR
jgi:hypothetical protein